MNLLTDRWLPIVRKSGKQEKIRISEIVDNYEKDPVIDIEAPRPDFRNSIYQLIIGIIQVAVTPKDDDWMKYWENPYSESELMKAFLNYENCFIIDNPEGPAFMQDYDYAAFKDAKVENVSSLLIEAPGTNTIKENKDHFIKRGVVKNMSPYWATIALYTLQTFAPSGGSGHRVGLRGGGPLTTIVLLDESEKKSTFWQKIWLNILTESKVENLSGNREKNKISDIFPWMAPTKTSSNGELTIPNNCNPLQMYFGMPRRIRLEYFDGKKNCDIDGEESLISVNKYKTIPRGINYGGMWMHPLNAYSIDPKKPEEEPLSIKAQPGGVCYRHWLGLNIKTEKNIPSCVVSDLEDNEDKNKIINEFGSLIWVAGFDMDNMKARCWYESTMPVFPLKSIEYREQLSVLSESMILGAVDCLKSLKSCIKQAWFDRPKDAKGDISFLDSEFWNNTEKLFYKYLKELLEDPFDEDNISKIFSQWSICLKKESNILFEKWCLSSSPEGIDYKRVISAKNELGKYLNRSCKVLKK